MTVDEMQLDFMSQRATIEAVFILGGCWERIVLVKKHVYAFFTCRKLLTVFQEGCLNGQ